MKELFLCSGQRYIPGLHQKSQTRSQTVLSHDLKFSTSNQHLDTRFDVGLTSIRRLRFQTRVVQLAVPSYLTIWNFPLQTSIWILGSTSVWLRYDVWDFKLESCNRPYDFHFLQSFEPCGFLFISTTVLFECMPRFVNGECDVKLVSTRVNKTTPGTIWNRIQFQSIVCEIELKILTKFENNIHSTIFNNIHTEFAFAHLRRYIIAYQMFCYYY